MPACKDFSDIKAKILLWKYEEGEEFDAEKLLEPENFDRIKEYHPKKLLETLMVRKILKDTLPGYKILYNNREPFLEPKDFEISITNSFPYAVLAISPYKIGIDIERFNPKLIRLKDKFIREEERDFIPKDEEMEYLTIIWSVKESLYKLHHSKHWSLKKHYEVLPFCRENLHSVRCRVHDDETSDEYYARVEFFEDYVFTIVD
ncbi:MAG: 4'-phosphopantetheinyl transferase superfamily protein [Bergeyella sp.]